jgi:predicted ArsR family transcriptional regulator
VKNVRTQEPVAVAARSGAPAGPTGVVPAGVTSEARTRDRVARTLLENGPLTAAALAEGLELTAAAVRRHLDALVADGLIEEREPRTFAPRGRGRPARLFGLTDTGRDTFDQAYDDLAARALRFLADQGGREAVVAFARERVAELEARYRPIVDAVPAQERTAALARALTGDGYAATARSTGTSHGTSTGTGTGEQLCQHHCPVAHVAEQFPELCEAETEVFAKLLGTHVQRLATIAHGDGVCTTYVPQPATTPPATTPSATTPPATTPPATRSSR